jgi:hypothetical protein
LLPGGAKSLPLATFRPLQQVPNKETHHPSAKFMTSPALLMSGATGKYTWEVLLHRRHSSDLASSDYNLFTTLKDHMM